MFFGKTDFGKILFHDFVDTLPEKGLIFNEGQMIDASFVLAPKQRNTREENEKIKKERVKNYGMISHKRKIIKATSKNCLQVILRNVDFVEVNDTKGLLECKVSSTKSRHISFA